MTLLGEKIAVLPELECALRRLLKVLDLAEGSVDVKGRSFCEAVNVREIAGRAPAGEKYAQVHRIQFSVLLLAQKDCLHSCRSECRISWAGLDAGLGRDH